MYLLNAGCDNYEWSFESSQVRSAPNCLNEINGCLRQLSPSENTITMHYAEMNGLSLLLDAGGRQSKY